MTPSGPIVFSHANGFPAATYRVLFDALRGAEFEVLSLDKFGHDPQYPVSDNWPHLREQLERFVERRSAGPAFLVGHSLGGFLSLMAACMRPDLARGVVLLDSPVIAGWRAHGLRFAKASGLIDRVSPGRVSRRRRHHWPSAEEAHRHFAPKAAFARWHPQALSDYVAQGTEPFGSGRRLSFSREIETHIYRTLPHHLPWLLRRHPPQCPVAFVGGTRSVEAKQAGIGATRRVTQGRISWVEGSHLFPFERPMETAAEIVRWVRAFDA
jgi:pimeloyl-ACP methyl ester carboxylesterase